MLSLAVAFAVPALAAQKISNADTRGGVDGIDAAPDIGVHNSYAWCSEVFKQQDSDYLWVGMNRDLGAILFGSTGSDFSLSAFGIPDASSDNAGRIYRQRVSDNNAEWELVYKNEGISGYRKMIVFNDDLYVLAGLSNRKSLFNDYSIVLRFSKDFKSGDAPDIVFWENVTGTTTEYFRSAAVLDGKLYIGTFDSKIYVTDGKDLKNLTPNAGPKDTGWSLGLDLPAYGMRKDGAIWDLLAFNGAVYAFVAHVGDGYQPSQGFGVYKITPNQSGYALKQVVGDNTAAYPYGLGVGINSLGISRNMTASGFISTSFGKDYVYVSTFANGPLFLGAMALGNYDAAFNNLFCPAQIYRFDANDNWEVVAGDEEGALVAVDNNGAQLPRVSDPSQRAGFFLQNYRYQNVSFNQYVWWMAEYQGKLYASTWDMSIFKQYYGLLTLMIFNDITDGSVLRLLGYVLEIESQLEKIFSDYAAVDVQALSEELGAYLQGIKDAAGKGAKLDVNEIIGGFSAIISKYFPMEETAGLVKSIAALATAVARLKLDPCQVITDTLAYISVTSLYFMDKSNPAGFDLYVSDNGKDFEAVTVDGFGDPCNYGGRVLVPSDHGLYVTTANPFNGGQVWRLDPISRGVYPNGPAEAKLGAGGSAVITVLVTDAPAHNDLRVDYRSDLVSVRLVKRGAAKTVTDVTWDNEVVCVPFTDRRVYQVTENVTEHTAVMYDAVITPLKSGSQKLTLSFKSGSVSAARTIAITVDLGSGGDPADPPGPTDPPCPTDPTDPKDPTCPTDPTKPTDPAKPPKPKDPVVTDAAASAYVEKINGNQNRLYITVTEKYSNGTVKNIEWNGLISNNAAGTYQVGAYKVYVDTKGNTQIRECYIVK